MRKMLLLIQPSLYIRVYCSCMSALYFTSLFILFATRKQYCFHKNSVKTTVHSRLGVPLMDSWAETRYHYDRFSTLTADKLGKSTFLRAHKNFTWDVG